MLINAEIDSIYNRFPESGRDMTQVEFRKQVRNILNPQKNAKILDQMVDARRKHTAAIMERKRIDRALERSRKGIE